MQKKNDIIFIKRIILLLKHTAQKMQVLPADLVTFTEEILNGKLHFLCSDTYNEVFIAIKVVI